jgi:D-alanine-D-alanine ligase
LFKGEERAQRIVTKKYVDDHWDEREKNYFRRYAYPIGNDVYILWALEPEEWSPQNHHCDANCAYEGLNVYTNRNIKKGEELTLDYAHFLDDTTCSYCRISRIGKNHFSQKPHARARGGGTDAGADHQ